MVHLNILLESNGDRPVGVYYPGEVINGVIELSLNERKKFRGCYVLIYGYARAHWSEERTRDEGHGDNRRTVRETIWYEGKEVFLNSKTYLFGHQGGEAKDMDAGIHRYNFSCNLPDMLPYSMSDCKGDIEYYVEARIDVPWTFDKEEKKIFTIVRYDDLNIYPELKVAQKMEEIKHFCCLFCRSGPLFINVSTTCSGFASGEQIPLRIDYINQSNTEVVQTNVKVKRVMSYTSHSPETKTIYDTQKMVEKTIDGVSKNGSVELVCSIDLPTVLMNTNERLCHVVRVGYYIEVEAVVSGCHANPKIQIPITIGSVGLRASTGFDVGHVNPYPEPSAPFIQMPSAPVGDINKVDLPPTFEEAIGMSGPYSQQSSNAIGWNTKT